jgi:beta-glucanase (GH16 family)
MASTLACHTSASPGFSESFDNFDQKLWMRGQHHLGRSQIDPANATISGGLLKLAVPAGTTNGAELRTRSTYGYGSYRARIRTANAPSSVTAIFLYVPPDYASEIDIEIYNTPSNGTARLSTYSGGTLTHTHEYELPFDPTLTSREYRIDYRPGTVSFYVDGSMIQTWTDGIPTQPMNLYLNAWFPEWLAGTVSPQPHVALVDSVEYTAD